MKKFDEVTPESSLHDPDLWCAVSDRDRRELLANELIRELEGEPGVQGARIEVGPVDRPYDLTATVETDVGLLRTPLWSDARATIFCDPSVHPANRRQLAPGKALKEAADRLRRRLAVPFSLKSRGLTLTQSVEDGVQRVWTAERSRFRGRGSVSREDRIANPAEVDLRDMLAHFYAGPALRVVAEDGSAFLLPAAAEAEDAYLVSLCMKCQHWDEGPRQECAACGGPVEVVAAVRPARR